jgi:hypothetical protein
MTIIQILVVWGVTPCGINGEFRLFEKASVFTLIISALKIVAACSFWTSEFTYKSTWSHNSG